MALRLRITRFSVFDQAIYPSGIVSADSQYKHVVYPLTGYIPITLDVIGKQCLNQQELVDYIFWEVGRKYAELALKYKNTDYTTE
jgi:hypothetical protein